MRPVRSKKTMRRIFLENPQLYKSVILSNHQAEIINLIKQRPKQSITSFDLSQRLKISIACASKTLRDLWLRDYLDRSEEIDVTGGIIYRYRVTV